MTQKPICRWGIMGTAAIARKNWHAILLANNAELVAVASRDQQKAIEFISECQRQFPHPVQPDAVEGYSALLERDDTDAVYIPIPTGMRKQWVIDAANAGKHVLCEKPCAENSADLAEMIAACRDNQVQFMDGVMMMHTDRIREFQSAAKEKIGAIRRIYSQLSFLADRQFRNDNIRTDHTLEKLGCLGDVGWYNVRLTLLAMQWQQPIRVRGISITDSDRSNDEATVPTSFMGELFFDNDVTAGFYCGFESHHQQWAFVSGTEGYIQVRDFVLPYANQDLAFQINRAAFKIDGCQFDMIENTELIKTAEMGNNAVDAQETKLFQNFSTLVNSNKVDESWSEYALLTQRVVDALYRSSLDDGKVVSVAKT